MSGLPPISGVGLTPPDPATVTDAYGLGRPLGAPVVVARGELGRIWRLETSTGRWAVKELLAPMDEVDARSDVTFQEAARRVGVSMPQPIVRIDGSVLADVGSADRPSRVRVYSWIDLAPRSAVVPATDAAAILGRIHALVFPDDRRPKSWFTERVDPSRWAELQAAAETTGASWTGTLRRLVPLIAAGDPIVAAGRHEPTIRCHLDFNPENVLVDTDGRTIVLDWENSGPATAEQELASAVAEFVPDPADVPGFLRAYADAGGPATLRDRSSFAMTLAFQANLVEWYATRALDPTIDAEDRARAVHWIGDIAAHAFTVERIDAWLASAG